MSKKFFAIIFLLWLLICLIIFYPRNKDFCVKEIISPIEIVMTDGSVFKPENLETFDAYYSEKNKALAKNFNITEDEAFILGNLANNWAKNILSNRTVKLFKDNLLYSKFGYVPRFENSAFCIKNGDFTNKTAFLKQLASIRKSKFVILDIDTDESYTVNKENAEKIKNFVVVRKTHAKKIQLRSGKKSDSTKLHFPAVPTKFEKGNIKIFVSDHTSKFKPDRNCSSDICKELLNNINNSSKTIDMAIYGYSSTPKIEEALRNAQKRGVKIRLVYDYSPKEDVYPETTVLLNLIPQNISDKFSENPEYIMHNKFYIFDEKKVLTGSANLSHTDMSGFNSNVIIVIDSENIAKIFEQEFEQMFSKKFHGSKYTYSKGAIDNLTIKFSPQDKGIRNTIIPAIKNAKNYIYISAFIITEKDFTQELINAHKRGVEIKIIADALNASNKYSRHTELRNAGIQVKTENYAGKMHSKSLIIDDKYTIIGSMNFSKAGEYKNDENFILLENSDAAKFYKQFFLYQWNKIPDKWLTKNVRAESKDSIGSCSDGVDNNYDGLIDSQDEGCK